MRIIRVERCFTPGKRELDCPYCDKEFDNPGELKAAWCGHPSWRVEPKLPPDGSIPSDCLLEEEKDASH